MSKEMGGTESAKLRARMIFEEEKCQQEILGRLPIEKITYCQYLSSMILSCNTKTGQMVKIYEKAVERMYSEEMDIREIID